MERLKPAAEDPHPGLDVHPDGPDLGVIAIELFCQLFVELEQFGELILRVQSGRIRGPGGSTSIGENWPG